MLNRRPAESADEYLLESNQHSGRRNENLAVERSYQSRERTKKSGGKIQRFPTGSKGQLQKRANFFFGRTFDLVSECNTFCACAVAVRGGA